MTLTRLLVRNLGRNTFRVSLTLVAIAIAAMVFVLLQTVQTAWDAVAQGSSSDRIVSQHATSYAITLPRTYVDEVLAQPGVKAVTYYNWLGGRDPEHESEYFGSWAIDQERYFALFPELVLSADARNAWRERRDAAIVGEVLARKLGWQVGDQISLESGLFPEQPVWRFQIVGTYATSKPSTSRSEVFVRWDYFNEQASAWHNERVGWIVSQVADAGRSADVASRIDAHFATRGTQTFTQDEEALTQSFRAGMTDMMKALDFASLGILAMMALLVGNLIAMAVRERTTEFAMLRAIGFSPARLSALVLGEAMLTGAIGGAAGVLLAYPLIGRGLGSFVETNLNALLPRFAIEPRTAAVAIAASMLTALAGAGLPASRLSRMQVTEALRRVQ